MAPSNEPEISHILGIDYGTAKIGLALADVETRIAFVYNTFKNNKDFLDKLAETIEKENVGEIIIGAPAYLNKSESAQAGEKFGEAIQKMFPEIRIEFQNEMFTTKMAQNNLIERGDKNIKKHDDAEAARIILQIWLDKSEARNSKSETNPKFK
ncbi:MAG: Holliday junction resolvase RuvX [Candidatus Pacebacteria bacterium]|nr:Holliday junction resolvase RuvX [Candidatus Paceibacterota bacterium]MDR3583581.1 Holliday junction resolvase RuvX [Candidatus Paceibacterota bacterium]